MLQLSNMALKALFLAISATLSLTNGAAAQSATVPKPFSTFEENVIWMPPINSTIMYPRLTELSDGTILATAGLNSQPAVFPIFSSSDGGASWTWISNLTDQVNGLGMTAQPAIYELPFDLSEKFPAGTVLASGNSWGNKSTNIDLYASFDKGHTWEFISNVARGSGPSTENGNPCIWEPFILAYNGTVGVFYSDQRDPLHAQKLAHQKSTDLINWGPVVNDVAYKTYTDRPGMTVITYIPPLKQFIFVYEYPGTPSLNASGGEQWSGQQFPVYYRFASSPFEFDNDRGYPIVVKGVQPGSSPYVVWSPVGGPNGTIIVSDNDHWDVFTNSHAGQPDRWEAHSTPQMNAYSRALWVPQNRTNHLIILGAARYSRAVHRPLSLSVVDIEELLKKEAGDAKPIMP
ncbi:vacuolar protein sorting/targeting protein 10 [Rhypophila decipiens]|uniref:Vacuolar protein sorting/targeting protein 10 n=1 Tax=Rhypophila decipiens TaxID=261697 RepID=A0AAN6Y111_9PEZI|nr:vacuolar protein sorting/targeting protein 10 [Rhypophila decipiens]